MMSAIFWYAATSPVVLAILAAILVASIVIGFAPLLSWVPGLAPYVKAARLVAFAAFGALAYLLGASGADQRAEINRLQTDLAFAETQIENLNATAAEKERLAALSAEAATAAQEKADAYVQYLATRPVSGGCALDGGDVERLRNIAPRRAGKPKRAAIPRLRGLGTP